MKNRISCLGHRRKFHFCKKKRSTSPNEQRCKLDFSVRPDTRRSRVSHWGTYATRVNFTAHIATQTPRFVRFRCFIKAVTSHLRQIGKRSKREETFVDLPDEEDVLLFSRPAVSPSLLPSLLFVEISEHLRPCEPRSTLPHTTYRGTRRKTTTRSPKPQKRISRDSSFFAYLGTCDWVSSHVSQDRSIEQVSRGAISPWRSALESLRADPRWLAQSTQWRATLRCLWHCADDDTREWPATGRGSRPLRFSHALFLCLFVCHSRSLLFTSHASSMESEQTEERKGGRERERIGRDFVAGSQDRTLTNCRRGSADDVCARLAASRPLLPSSTWKPSLTPLGRVQCLLYRVSFFKRRLPPSSAIPFKPTRASLSLLRGHSPLS